MRSRPGPTLPAALAAAVSFAIVLSACGGPGGSGSGSGTEHPSGDEVVLRVEHRGGFVPVEWLFSGTPAFTLVGDGRVIVPGAVEAIFPGPALPPLMVRRLNDDGVEAVLQAVGATKQFARDAQWQGARNFVADAAETVFTVHADGQDVVVSIYGLGAFLPNEAPPQVSREELAAHVALSALADRLGNPDAWIPATGWAETGWQAYSPTALRLLVRNADADPPDDSGIAAPLVPWPTGGDPEDFGEPYGLLDGASCGVVTGEEARSWYAALAQANQLTRFTAGDHRYQVIPRPLLPDEEPACLPPA